jgi:hypothetical protein
MISMFADSATEADSNLAVTAVALDFLTGVLTTGLV